MIEFLTVSSDDPIVKAKEYAANKYSSVRDEIQRQADEALAQTRAHLASRGLVNSSVMAKAIGDNRVDLMRRLIQARVAALIDGFEIFSAPITEDLANYILAEAERVHSQTFPKAMTVASGPTIAVGSMATNIVNSFSVPTAAIRCQIEERRANPRMRQPTASTVYHVSGNNSRINVASTDQSVNMVATTSEQIFQTLREAIHSGIPSEYQPDILARLGALEEAQNSTLFGVRYTEFIAAAANHMTIIGPFLPALTELLRKIL